MKFVEHIGNKLPIYILLAFLALLMIYYALVYVPGNEDELNSYAVRVLQNKAVSIKEKYQAYGNAINSGTLSYFATWFFDSDTSKQVHVVQVRQEYHASTCLDCLPKGTNVTLKTISTDALKLARCDKNLRPTRYGAGTHGSSRDLWKVNNGDFYFIYSPRIRFLIHSDSTAHKATDKHGMCKTRLDTADQYFWLKVRDFTANLKSNDFFADIFIVRDTHTKGQDLNKQSEIAGYDNDVLDESKLGIVRFQIPDTATQTGPGLSTRTIAGKAYKVYYQPVPLKRGLNIYIVGLIAADTFNREARQVEPWFFVFCALGSLILILLLPLLKLFFLNAYERLSASDARFSVFSVIASVSLLVTIITGSFVFWGTERQSIDEKLCALSDSIGSNLKREIADLRHILDDPNLFLVDDVSKRLRTKMENGGISFNEVFSLTEDGDMKDVFLGKANTEIDVNTFPVRLSGRRYFQEVKRVIDANEEKNLDFFIESINSLSSGNSEAAISIPYPNCGKGIIRVITSSLPSVINAVLPAPYKFVVLDEEGIILFHSGQSEHKFENFILECDNDNELRAHLANDVKGYVDFSYVRNDCRAYVRPLLKDWHLVVYYELANTRNFAAQIFSLCLITLVVVTLYSIVLHLVLRHNVKKPYLLSMRPFVFDWLNPNQHEASVWKGLMLLNLFLFIVELIWIVFNRSITLSVLFVFLMMTVTYFSNYKKLTSHIVARSKRPLVVMLILICVWSALIVIKSLANNNFAIWIAGPLVGIIWLIASRPRKVSAPAQDAPPPAEPASYHPYIWYLCSWLLVIAIGPTLIFFADHFRFNTLIRTYSYALEDVRNVQAASTIQKKNFTLANYTAASLSADSGLDTLDLDTLDVLFYAQAPRYVTHDPAIGGLQFNYVPAYRDYTILSSPRHVKVTANHPAPGWTQVASLQASLSYDNSRFSISEFYFMTAAVLSLILFWWAMRAIPRRIFYMPDHNYWRNHSYEALRNTTAGHTDQGAASNPRTLVSAFASEFRDDDQPQHPLHDFPDKVKLLKAYQKAVNRAETDEHKDFIAEEFILKLQKAAEAHYMEVWKNLTEKEQFFLYDLAEDGVANQTDQILIGTMAKKGLVRLSPKLELVNYSFANYAKESMKREDLAKRDAKEGTHGRWKNLRTMLIIVIVAAIAFLSIAEQGFLGRASAIIASIGILIPNLVNIFGTVGKWVGGKPS